MRGNGKKAPLLICALLLAALCACNGGESGEAPSSSPTTVTPSPSATQDKQPVESDGEAEELEEGVLWDASHTLNVAFDPVPEGQLELPVQGATGYASVELPLWPQIPEETEEEPEAVETEEPAAASAPPAATETPEPSPLPEESPPAEGSPTPETSPSAEGALPPEESPPVEGAETSAPTDETAAPEESAPPPEAEPSPEPAPSAEPAPSESVPPSAEPEPSPEPSPSPEPDPYEGAVAVLEPGTPFTILQEEGEWWQVTAGADTGWIEHRYCLINLPDVIPTIVNNATNSTASWVVSRGSELPGVTGKALYSCRTYNPRLGREEYLMPVLYTMAKHICQAQQAALAEGNTLVLYETYRPYETQRAVVRAVQTLASTDEQVKAGISTAPWNIAWFISTGISNHQRGFAIDVSLAKVEDAQIKWYGRYSCVQVQTWEEYDMPTAIHELSMAAATFTEPVASLSGTAWKSAELTPAMKASESAQALQRYCTQAHLTPLASEWWHFNDLEAYNQIRENMSTGGYQITRCLSTSVK